MVVTSCLRSIKDVQVTVRINGVGNVLPVDGFAIGGKLEFKDRVRRIEFIVAGVVHDFVKQVAISMEDRFVLSVSNIVHASARGASTKAPPVIIKHLVDHSR